MALPGFLHLAPLGASVPESDRQASQSSEAVHLLPFERALDTNNVSFQQTAQENLGLQAHQRGSGAEVSTTGKPEVVVGVALGEKLVGALKVSGVAIARAQV